MHFEFLEARQMHEVFPSLAVLLTVEDSGLGAVTFCFLWSLKYAYHHFCSYRLRLIVML